MLIPEKTKYKKYQKRKIASIEYKPLSSYKLQHGVVGLQALENGLITPNQIESARRVLIRGIRKTGKMWIQIFPNWVVTRKAKGVRMGRGKGEPENHVFKIKKGRILIELDTSVKKNLSHLLLLASVKLPIKTRLINKNL
jgi:large subunit ribosomal protein L16